MDGVQLSAPFVLSLFELLGTEQFGEGIAMLVALLDPCLGHLGELGGAVGLFDPGEAGPLEELPVGKVGGDGDRAVAVSPPP